MRCALCQFADTGVISAMPKGIKLSTQAAGLVIVLLVRCKTLWNKKDQLSMLP